MSPNSPAQVDLTPSAANSASKLMSPAGTAESVKISIT